MKVEVLNSLKIDIKPNSKTNKKSAQSFQELLGKISNDTGSTNYENNIKIEKNTAFDETNYSVDMENQDEEDDTILNQDDSNLIKDLISKLKQIIEEYAENNDLSKMDATDPLKNMKAILNQIITFVNTLSRTINMTEYEINNKNSTDNVFVNIPNPKNLSTKLTNIFYRTDETENSIQKDGLNELNKLLDEILNSDQVDMSDFKNLLEKIDELSLGKPKSKSTLEMKDNSFLQLDSQKNANATVAKNINESKVEFPKHEKVTAAKALVEEKMENKLPVNGENEFDVITDDESSSKQISVENNVNRLTEKVIEKSNLKTEIERIITPQKTNEIIQIAVDRFRSLRLPDITELRVKLNPEDLGEITVKVVLEKGEVKGNILVEKWEVAAALQSQIENLKQELRNSNVNITNVAINLNNDNLNERNGHGFKQQNGQNRHNFDEQFIEFEKKVENHDGLNIIA